MELAQPSICSEFRGGNALAVVLDGTISTGVIVRLINLRSTRIKRILEQSADDSIEGGYSNGGFDLANHVLRQALDGHCLGVCVIRTLFILAGSGCKGESK